MKKTFIIILTLIGFISFGQENKLVGIDSEVNSIESDSTLSESKFSLEKTSDLKMTNGRTLSETIAKER